MIDFTGEFDVDKKIYKSLRKKTKTRNKALKPIRIIKKLPNVNFLHVQENNCFIV